MHQIKNLLKQVYALDCCLLDALTALTDKEIELIKRNLQGIKKVLHNKIK